MGYGWRYCVCGKRFYQHVASNFNCPDCQAKDKDEGIVIVTGATTKKLGCYRCEKKTTHSLVGPYHGNTGENEYYWKCSSCGRWKPAERKGLIT